MVNYRIVSIRYKAKYRQTGRGLGTAMNRKLCKAQSKLKLLLYFSLTVSLSFYYNSNILPKNNNMYIF